MKEDFTGLPCKREDCVLEAYYHDRSPRSAPRTKFNRDGEVIFREAVTTMKVVGCDTCKRRWLVAKRPDDDKPPVWGQNAGPVIP